MTYTPVFERAYKINGIAIPFPAEGHWVDRNPLGTDGNNIKVYPPVRSFELTWTNLLPSEWRALYAFWQAISASGSVTAELPSLIPVTPVGPVSEWGTEFDTYENFTTYSGCVLDEPTVGPFDQRTYPNAHMVIRNITA